MTEGNRRNKDLCFFFLNYIFVFRKQYMKNRCVACPLMDEGPGGVYRMENNRQ